VLEPGLDLRVEHRSSRDGGAHEPRPDDPETTDPHRHHVGAGWHAIIFLQRSRRKEDLDQLSRHRAHRQLGESLALRPVSFGRAPFQPRSYDLESYERSRIVAAGLFETLLARRPLPESPPERRSTDERPDSPPRSTPPGGSVESEVAGGSRGDL